MVNILSTIIGIVAAAFVYIELAGIKLSFIPQGFRMGFIILAALGFAMCIVGGRIASGADGSADWTNPYIIVGSIIGTIAILATFSMIFFKKVPFLDDRTAFIVLAVLILAKFVINIVRFLTAK